MKRCVLWRGGGASFAPRGFAPWNPCLVALSLTGCFFHVETARNAPAKLTTRLEDAPASLGGTGVQDKGDDTGMQGVLGHATLFLGGNIDSKGNGGAVGMELGATPFELDKWRDPETPIDAQPHIWWRPSIGWMFYDERAPYRANQPATHDGHVGPLYGEVQLFPWQGKNGLGTFMVGLGGKVELAYEDGGPQATICGGPFVVMLACLRGSYLVNRGPELGIFVSVSTLATVAWAK
jgi:hypothetical protein